MAVRQPAEVLCSGSIKSRGGDGGSWGEAPSTSMRGKANLESRTLIVDLGEVIIRPLVVTGDGMQDMAVEVRSGGVCDGWRQTTHDVVEACVSTILEEKVVDVPICASSQSREGGGDLGDNGSSCVQLVLEGTNRHASNHEAVRGPGEALQIVRDRGKSSLKAVRGGIECTPGRTIELGVMRIAVQSQVITGAKSIIAGRLECIREGGVDVDIVCISRKANIGMSC